MAFVLHRRFLDRRLLLFVGDVIGISGSLAAATYLRFLRVNAAWQEYLVTHLSSLSTIGVVFLVVFYAAGMYERQTLSRNAKINTLLGVTVAIAMMLSILILYARFDMRVGRGILFIAGIFIFLSTRGIRSFYRVAIGYGVLARKTLIVGPEDMANDVLDLLHGTEDAGYKVSGVVTVSELDMGRSLYGTPVVGHLDQLQKIVSIHNVESIVFATPLLRSPNLLHVLHSLRYAGIEILDDVTLREKVFQEISITHVDDEWFVNAAIKSSVVHTRIIKRLVDIVGSFMGIIVCAPVALITAILVKLDSPGPILYRQRRAKMHGESYTLLKFRTMVEDAESESGARWADAYDERVTCIGTFLRKWRIDELPQFVNVLKGEMSLVGPRPERPEFIDTLVEKIPYYRARLLVPPGITGWAQIRFPYAASIEASRRKHQYDLYYYKNMSLLLDLQILLKTFSVILQGIRHSGDVVDKFAAEQRI